MPGSKKKKENSGGLRRLFLAMTVLPIIVMGIFILCVDYGIYSNGLHEEVKRGLGSTARTVLAVLDEKYPGDYNLLVNESTGEKILKKGDALVEDDMQLLDRIASENDLDISVFFYDTRMMTTIKDSEGGRITGSVVNGVVVEPVLKEGQETFFSSVQIAGRKYFALYIPIYSQKGTCLGMIGIAKPASLVASMVNRAMAWNALLVAAAVILVSIVIRKCTDSIVAVLLRMENFLGEISKGNLNSRIDETITSRNDEIGDMGRFTEHVQASLRKLIERDALTGIYNRRSGMNKIIQSRDKDRSFAVAMGDIDFFKKVNDTYGHDAGDEVLRTIARIISDAMVGKGFVARWGGEEFLMVFDEMNSEDAAAVLRQMLDTIRATEVVCNDQHIKVTMSYGVTEGDISQDVDSQIKRADNGLYYSKTHGRNRVTEYDKLQEETEDNPDNTVDASPIEGIPKEN